MPPTSLEAEPLVCSDWVYKEIRAHIEHENSLINHRMTWLIALQSFLFGSYGFTIGAQSNPRGEAVADLVKNARTGFVVMGIVSSIVMLIALFAAARSITKLVEFWNREFKDVRNKYPQIIGNHPLIVSGSMSQTGANLDRVLDTAVLKNRIVSKGMFMGLAPVFMLPISMVMVWGYIGWQNQFLLVFILSIIIPILAFFTVYGAYAWITRRYSVKNERIG